MPPAMFSSKLAQLQMGRPKGSSFLRHCSRPLGLPKAVENIVFPVSRWTSGCRDKKVDIERILITEWRMIVPDWNKSENGLRNLLETRRRPTHRLSWIAPENAHKFKRAAASRKYWTQAGSVNSMKLGENQTENGERRTKHAGSKFIESDITTKDPGH
jgi:hypothetical protein